MGIEMDNWVRSDWTSISGHERADRLGWLLGQSSMKCRSDCCCCWFGSVVSDRSVRSREEPKLRQFNREVFFCEGLRSESVGTSPNSLDEPVKNEVSLDNNERPEVFCCGILQSSS
ncbi:hypothetical protein PanWU01x14_115720, partial [Parasponia andersonii]